MQPQRQAHNPYLFTREPNGSVRVRLRLTKDEAGLIETAAGGVPLILWMLSTLLIAADRAVLDDDGREL